MASIRELLEQSVLMGLGAVSLTRETAQHLVDEMVKRGQAQREEASEMVEQLIQRGEKSATPCANSSARKSTRCCANCNCQRTPI